MQRNRPSYNPDRNRQKETKPNDFTCDECGGTFNRPLLATAFTNDQTMKYYACPRCMTQIQVTTSLQKGPAPETKAVLDDQEKPSDRSDHVEKCEHAFGYLRKKQKNAPIPEECLTCSQMVECLMQ